MPVPRPSALARLFLLSLLIVASGCDTLPTEEEITGNVVEQLDRRSSFGALSEALESAGLAATLASGAYTILAPTDIAFEYAGEDFLRSISEDRSRDVLTRVLRHHVIAGRLSPEAFVDGATFQTLDGRTLTVQRSGPFVRVDGVTIDLAEGIDAEGSIAYPTSDVLLGALRLRERLELSPSVSRFLSISNQVDLLDQAESLGEATLLVPLNDAITALGGIGNSLFGLSSNADVRARVFRFHLVPGTPPLADGQTLQSVEGAPLLVSVDARGVRTIEGARVLREEILADGRLLIMGDVILEPLTLAQHLRIDPALSMYWQEIRAELPDVWARLQDEDESLTVFAPTGAGYQSRGAALNNALTDPLNSNLNDKLLRVHIVDGALTPEALLASGEITGFDGSIFTILGTVARPLLDGKPLRGARKASNGVLYVVDSFILPRVDLFDSILLQGFARHFQAVRQAGLESVFRTPGTTAFLASDSLFSQGPSRLISDPGPFIAYTATAASLPTLADAPSFTTLGGTERFIRVVPCPEGEEEDRACSPYQLPDGRQVYQGRPSSDGTGTYHVLRSLSLPAGF